MRKKSFREILIQDLLTHKWLVAIILWVTILCFGFTVTNFSIGVDDTTRNYYLYTHSEGSLIQQGRLMHVVLNYLTRSIQFIPFFTEFVGATLYAASALLFCALFQYVTDSKLSNASLCAFCCIYISSSIIAEKYIYHLDVIATMLSFCLTALSLLQSYRFVKEERRVCHFLSAVVLMMGAMSSYESFVCLYFCGVFILFLLEMFACRERKAFHALLEEGLQYAAILLLSLACYYSLVYLVQILTSQYGIFQRFSYWKYSTLGFAETFLVITGNIAAVFLQAISNRYLPILVFCLLSGIGLALFTGVGIYRKNPWIPICYLALWIGNFPIHYIVGDFVFRIAQTFCLFTGFVALILLESCSVKKLLLRFACGAIALLVFIQSADMNRWFYNDYIRYQKEAFTVHSIATRLVSECDVSKSVVFTNLPVYDYWTTSVYHGSQVLGNSLIIWSVYAFDNPYQPLIPELFKMHGYDFVRSPTEEQFQLAHEVSAHLPPWPHPDSILELDDVIVVNFG